MYTYFGIPYILNINNIGLIRSVINKVFRSLPGIVLVGGGVD